MLVHFCDECHKFHRGKVYKWHGKLLCLFCYLAASLLWNTAGGVA